MKELVYLDQHEVAGLFELDEWGTILYSKSLSSENGFKQDLIGRNLFDEVLGFDNVAEFRHRFASFALNQSSVESFRFTCLRADDATRLKVMLVRISEQTGTERKKTILVDIRKD